MTTEAYEAVLTFKNFRKPATTLPQKASLDGLRDVARFYVETLIEHLEAHEREAFIGHTAKALGDDVEIMFEFSTLEAAERFKAMTQASEQRAA